MRGMLRSSGIVTIFLLFPAAGLSAQDEGHGTEAEGRTTTHGVYSEDQASRGEDVMWNVCAECHVDADFGRAFLSSWEGATVRALLDDIKATMPEDNPGGLRDAAYLDVIAYIFKLNGLPAGDAEMEDADLDEIEISIEP